MTNQRQTIYIYAREDGPEWVVGTAIIRSNPTPEHEWERIAGHLSSSMGFFRHDMGLTSEWKHELYKAACPDGYDLKEISFAEARALTAKKEASK